MIAYVPDVSILMPVYNVEGTLTSALRSVVVQSAPNFECVIVDDGSTDRTRAIARRAAARDPRFRAIFREHRGIVDALNAGLSECRGRFIARMDGDDRMHPDRLHRQLQALERAPELAGLGCHVRLFPRAGLTDGLLAYEAWLNSISSEADIAKNRFIECPLAHPTLFLRREVLIRHAYRDLGWPEDYDLVLRLLAERERLGVVPEALLAWRDSKTRLSRTDPVYAQGRFVACKAEFLNRSWLDAPGYVLWGYGDTGRALCRALARLGRHPTHIVELHPGRIGQRVAGAPVIHPEELAKLRPRPTRVVVSVASARARGEIRAAMTAAAFVEEQDYVFAA